jgi:hypothetical protein
VMPEANIEGTRTSEGECQLIGVRTVGEALDHLL